MMVSGIGTSSGLPSSSTPSTTEAAMVQAQQTLKNSRTASLLFGPPASSYSVSPADAGTYSYQMIYDSIFLNALTSSNERVTATGIGKTVLPFNNAPEDIPSGNDTWNNYRALFSLRSKAPTNPFDMSDLILGSLYSRSGYDPAKLGSQLKAQA